jgi:flagellar protein FliL
MTGKAGLDKVLMLLNLILMLGGTGVFIYTSVVYQRPLPEDSASYKEFLEEVNRSKYLEAIKLDELTVNLPSETKRLRFLSMQAHLEPVKIKQIDNINQKKEIVLDRIIEVASAMSPDVLNTVTGKLKLEHQIAESVNQVFGSPVVKRIFFSKFIVQ